MIGGLLAVCSVPVLLACGVAAAAPVGDPFEGLHSDNETVRFDTAHALVESGDESLDVRLGEAIEQGAFASSETATAAAQFVRRKRAGEVFARPPAEDGGEPSVLLISIDTLRSDHLRCYGYGRSTSPAIDDLASRGVLFENAISPASWTLPSHMSIFTSLYPSFHKLDKGGKVGNTRLDSSEVTLTQMLKGRGAATAAFVSHPFLAKEWGFERGFDLYRERGGRAGRQSARASLWLEWHAFHARRGLSAPPFFLFVHYIDPHETYDAPAPYGDRFSAGYTGRLESGDKMVTLFSSRDFESPADFQYVIDLYDGEISYVDAEVGRLLSALRDLGWEESTIVVLTSDHGEEFKDHGSMGHKATLYEEQLRVPLIITCPRRIEAGQRISGQVSLLDILPTVVDLVDGRPRKGAQGISLVPYMRKRGSSRRPKAPPSRDLFAELGPLGYKWERSFYRRVIRTGDYKLIHNFNLSGLTGKELYRLADDPGEERNIYRDRAESPEVRAMEERLTSFMKEAAGYKPELRERNDIELRQEIWDKLRALGYID